MDLTLASNDSVLLEQEKKNLADDIDMVDQGEIKYILGMSITRDRQGVLRIDQSAYLLNVLKRFGMDNYQVDPFNTMETGKSFKKLYPDEEPVDLKYY